MLTVGLTGSIAVGKSFVSSILSELGCHVLDADVTAREVVAPGSDGLAAVAEAFGPEVIAIDGSMDRKKVASIVFADEAKRVLLNSIIHPRVIDAQNSWIEKVEELDPNAIAVVDAALMIESGGYKRFDELIVVWCDPDIQLQRLMARDGLSLETARGRIAAQMSQDEKKSFADHLIDTSGSIEDTRARTVEVFTELDKLRGRSIR